MNMTKIIRTVTNKSELIHSDIIHSQEFTSLSVQPGSEQELVVLTRSNELFKLTVNCLAHSKLKLFVVSISDSDNFCSNTDVTINLTGIYANVLLFSMAYGINNSNISSSIEVVHVGKSTKSKVYSSAIVLDSAKSSFKGKIRITKKAFNADAYLKDTSLMIGEKSCVVSLPSMIIDNNDVRASHGASIGCIDSDHLFYMLSRGLSFSDVLSLIIDGYFNHIRDSITSLRAKNIINSMIEKAKNQAKNMNY